MVRKELNIYGAVVLLKQMDGCRQDTKSEQINRRKIKYSKDKIFFLIPREGIKSKLEAVFFLAKIKRSLILPSLSQIIFVFYNIKNF